MNVHMINKKKAILQATLELITENGFHGAPMAQVSQRANVAAGTIYHYFKSKEELIDELYASLKEKMGIALLQENNESGGVKERFFKFWLNLFEHFANNPKEFNFLEQYGNSPMVSKTLRDENFKHYKPVIEFLADGIKKGVLREMPIELMTAIVYGSVVSCVKLHLAGMQMEGKTLKIGMQSCWDSVKIT